MASSSHHRLLLILFLLAASLLHLTSCGDDNDRLVLKCESGIINDRNILISETNKAIYFLVHMPYPTANIHYTTVYGLSWCRSDISTTFCSSCLSIAANKIRNDCPPNTVAARFLFYDFCYLRVDVKNFIGQPDTSFGKVWSNMAVDIAKAHKRFYWEKVDELLNRVKRETPRHMTKFIEMDTNFNIEKLTITGMALCSRDLSTEGCSHCLDQAMNVMKIRCVYRTFCEVVYGSCFLKYRTTRK